MRRQGKQGRCGAIIVTVGLRALAKSKTYAFINIFGLAIGMAACLMILLYVRYEMSYDRWIPGADRVYQVQTWYKSSETGQEAQLQMTPYASGKSLETASRRSSRKFTSTTTTRSFSGTARRRRPRTISLSTRNFLDVVPLPTVRGDASALSQVNTAVITQSEARRRFGTDDVVGRTMTLITRGVSRDFRITGILQDLPRNSHFEINSLIRIDFAAYNDDTPQALECWGCQNGYVYVKLRPGADVGAIRAGSRPGRIAPFPTRMPARRDSMPATIRTGISSMSRTSISAAPRRRRWRRATTGRRSSPSPSSPCSSSAWRSSTSPISRPPGRASGRGRWRFERRSGASRRQLIVQFLGEIDHHGRRRDADRAWPWSKSLMPAFAAFLEADLKVSYFGADGIALPVVLLVVVVGIARRSLPGLLPVALRAGVGAQGQQVVVGNAGIGAAAQRARRRPVRRLDRAHHLHRHHLRPDRLRPHGRPRLQPEQHPPDRRAVALPAAQPGRGDRRTRCSESRASRRSGGRTSASPPTTTTIPE